LQKSFEKVGLGIVEAVKDIAKEVTKSRIEIQPLKNEMECLKKFATLLSDVSKVKAKDSKSEAKPKRRKRSELSLLQEPEPRVTRRTKRNDNK
jgi:hypothetical protein